MNVSEELALVGRERVGELVPRNGSKPPKKDHLLGVLHGLGVDGSLRSGSGNDGRRGIEFRRRGDAPVDSSTLLLCVRSMTAPAVLGLDSGLERDGLRTSGEAGSLSAIVELANEMIDEMLPETECPGRAVTVLDVSLEMRDSGLGINSRVSEKPTLARFTGRGAGFGTPTTELVGVTVGCDTSSTVTGGFVSGFGSRSFISGKT